MIIRGLKSNSKRGNSISGSRRSVNRARNLAEALVDEIIEACLSFKVEHNRELNEND